MVVEARGDGVFIRTLHVVCIKSTAEARRVLEEGLEECIELLKRLGRLML